MVKCERCGKAIVRENDIYTYQNMRLCDDCAVSLQSRDYQQPRIMGCVGPAWKVLKEKEKE